MKLITRQECLQYIGASFMQFLISRIILFLFQFTNLWLETGKPFNRIAQEGQSDSTVSFIGVHAAYQELTAF